MSETAAVFDKLADMAAGMHLHENWQEQRASMERAMEESRQRLNSLRNQEKEVIASLERQKAAHDSLKASADGIIAEARAEAARLVQEAQQHVANIISDAREQATSRLKSATDAVATVHKIVADKQATVNALSTDIDVKRRTVQQLDDSLKAHRELALKI